MVDLKFFIIEEGLSTLWTLTMLSLRELLFGEREIAGCAALSFHPVALETRIIR